MHNNKTVLIIVLLLIAQIFLKSIIFAFSQTADSNVMPTGLLPAPVIIKKFKALYKCIDITAYLGMNL